MIVPANAEIGSWRIVEQRWSDSMLVIGEDKEEIEGNEALKEGGRMRDSSYPQADPFVPQNLPGRK